MFILQITLYALFLSSNLNYAQNSKVSLVDLNKKVAPTLITLFSEGASQSKDTSWQYSDIYKKHFEDDYTFDHGLVSYKSLGTGFLISSDGYILTNNNLIENAGKISAKIFQDNKNFFEVSVIGKDPTSQLALLKIKTGSLLPHLEISDIKILNVGEPVIAFGNPSGQTNNMMPGIISRVGKKQSEVNQFPVLETNISIHSGNVGGPLVSYDGKVVGLNADIKNRIGLGFHVPSYFIKELIPLMQKNGKLKRGTLGLRLSNPIKPQKGAYVESVKRNSQAHAAGIETGNLIIKLGDTDISSADDLIMKLRSIPAEEPVQITWLHFNGNAQIEKTMTLSLREFDGANTKNENKNESDTEKRLHSLGSQAPHDLGFYITDSSSGARRDYKVPLSTPFGPIITKITPNSPASRSFLKVGDVITEVNEKPVQDSGDVLRFLNSQSNTLKAARGKEITETISIQSTSK